MTRLQGFYSMGCFLILAAFHFPVGPDKAAFCTAAALIGQRRHFCTQWNLSDVTWHRSHFIPSARTASSPRLPLSLAAHLLTAICLFSAQACCWTMAPMLAAGAAVCLGIKLQLFTLFFFWAFRDKICRNASKRWTLNEHAARMT